MTTRLLLPALLLCATNALAQNQRLGAIRLEVKDTAGTALAATGILENLATGVSQSLQTNAQGQILLTGLSFGRYRLEISQPGFAAQSVLVEVQSATPITRTVTLSVGSLAFNVDVVATTPLPGSGLGADEIAAPVY